MKTNIEQVWPKLVVVMLALLFISSCTGNSGSNSTAQADTTNPQITILTPTGDSTYTVTSSPLAISGTASDDVGVTQVIWGNSLGGSGTCSGTTNWSASVPLVSGSNAIAVTARDAAGNTWTDLLTVTYTPDTAAPVVTFNTPTTLETFSYPYSGICIGGTISDNVGVTEMTWSNSLGGSGTCAVTEVWSACLLLEEGANVITVTAWDAAGNSTTKTVTINYTPDTADPAVSITTPTTDADCTALSTPLAIGGTASDFVGVTRVTWSNSLGGGGTCDGTTSWSASIPLSNGSNVITVTAWDAAENSSTDTLTVTYSPSAVDTTDPVVSILTPTNSSTYTATSSTLAIGGSAADNVGVTSLHWFNNMGGEGNCTGTTNWSASIPLSSGSNVITVTAWDAAGNSSTDTLTATYSTDTTDPLVTITTPTTDSSYTASSTPLAISGTASDNVGVTHVTWNSNSGDSGTCSGTTNWSASIPLSVGNNVILITAFDAAGNSATDTLLVSLVDTTNPMVRITSPTTTGLYIVDDSYITISGYASDNIGVTQISYETSWDSGFCSGTTNWSATVNIARPNSYHIFNIIVTARDAAGNTSTDTIQVHNAACTPGRTLCIPGDVGSEWVCNSTSTGWEVADCGDFAMCSYDQCKPVCEITSPPLYPTACMVPHHDYSNEGIYIFSNAPELASPEYIYSYEGNNLIAKYFTMDTVWDTAFAVQDSWLSVLFRLDQFPGDKNVVLQFRAQGNASINPNTWEVEKEFVGAVDSYCGGDISAGWDYYSCSALGSNSAGWNIFTLSSTGLYPVGGYNGFLGVEYLKLIFKPAVMP